MTTSTPAYRKLRLSLNYDADASTLSERLPTTKMANMRYLLQLSSFSISVLLHIWLVRVERSKSATMINYVSTIAQIMSQLATQVDWSSRLKQSMPGLRTAVLLLLYLSYDLSRSQFNFCRAHAARVAYPSSISPRLVAIPTAIF